MTASKSKQDPSHQVLGWSAYCAQAQALADEAARKSARDVTSTTKQDMGDASGRH